MLLIFGKLGVCWMKSNVYIAVCIIGLLAFSGNILEKTEFAARNGGAKTGSTIKNEKVLAGFSLDTVFPESFRQKTEETLQAPFVHFQNTRAGAFYREQPLLFTFFITFGSILFGAIWFIFYLIHTDPRFH